MIVNVAAYICRLWQQTPKTVLFVKEEEEDVFEGIHIYHIWSFSCVFVKSVIESYSLEIVFLTVLELWQQPRQMLWEHETQHS